MSRQIEMLPLNELEADPRNPKAHREDLIESSVGRFGYVEPMVVDGRTGYLISGHGRRSALQKMESAGEDPPDGVEVDDDGRWLAPVVTGWASSDDNEAAAALIAMNRTTELGGWVDETLLELLNDLSEIDELDGVGFDDKDIERLRELVEGADPPEWSDKSAGDSQGVKDHYEVIISCSDEEEQENVLEEMMNAGYDVRALTT